MVQSLFGRFVLDRLGSMYGHVNLMLERAGYLTQAEAPVVMEHSA